MKKSDLRSGMLVLQASGKIKMVLNGTLIAGSDGAWSPLSNYYENLESRVSPPSDIVAVSQKLSGEYLSTANWTLQTVERFLLWKRPSCQIKLGEPVKSEKPYAVIDGKEYTREELMEGIVNIIRTL